MSHSNARSFSDSPAVRSQVPLFVGLVGPSSSGKTFSALRLATGMQRSTGGEIFVIDTEASRSLHYADRFKFRHVPFAAPFDPLSYLAAVQHCAAKGAKVIVIDSASHMHEGPGGTLEAHEEECQRLAKLWNTSTDKAKMSAWQKPKSELRRFLNEILQMRVNIIFCYRAKEKVKVEASGKPKPLGFMPIAGEEMIYESTVNCLLYPNSGGAPSWHPDEIGEKAIIKLPEQFRDLFSKSRPLDEDTGEALAKWAGGASAPVPAKQVAPKAASHDETKLAAAHQENLATIGQRAAELKWVATHAQNWLMKHFGVKSRSELTPLQAQDAASLLTTRAADGEDIYSTELEKLVELGRAQMGGAK